MPRNTRPQVFRLFGFAGTGKTTLAKEVAKMERGKVLYATFTGKAALVLQGNGCEDCSTLHSLIYQFEVDQVTGEAIFSLNPSSELYDASLLVIDEVSMVDEFLGSDVLSFGTDILVIGDPAQLPPIKGAGFFIDANPDIMLTDIHRQAQDNPIIRMSMDVREGRRLQFGSYGESAVIDRRKVDRDELRHHVLEADQVLCGLNRTRISYNRRIRELKGLITHDEWMPSIGDQLICLRNNREKFIFNGGMWSVIDFAQTDGGSVEVRIVSHDQKRDPLDVHIAREFFEGKEATMDWRVRREFDEFTFGWAITGHKSQGSQWGNVLIFDESAAFREFRNNHLYTTITRASERVKVIL